MESLREVLKHPDELFYLVKLKMALRGAEKNIPPQPHWGFCYTMLYKFLRNALIFQQFETNIKDAVCIFYLVLRVLDTIEDDTGIPTEVKVPILIDFYRHLHDHDWHFSCGTRNLDKVVVDEFHHVSTAFMELEKGHQETIVDITKRMGAGMAKFIGKEIATTNDYDEYCHYSAELVEIGLFKLFSASQQQDPIREKLCGSTFIFYQKRDMIEDYLEDINEKPKPRIFWPREIWSKYVDKIEDLQYKENSVKALQCLNEMVTDALKHAGDCLKHLSTLKDDAALQFFGVLAIKGIGTLVLCYNNIEVFKAKVRLRRGLAARLYERTKTMSDIYNVFFEFASVMKSKVEMHDPNAMKTLSRLNEIQEICRNSGLLNQSKFYIIKSEQGYNFSIVTALSILLFIMFAYLSTNHQYYKYCCLKQSQQDESGMADLVISKQGIHLCIDLKEQGSGSMWQSSGEEVQLSEVERNLNLEHTSKSAGVHDIKLNKSDMDKGEADRRMDGNMGTQLKNQKENNGSGLDSTIKKIFGTKFLKRKLRIWGLTLNVDFTVREEIKHAQIRKPTQMAKP
ncbi:hypothetical protein Ddye_003998 [Dipteronia dyeriana]|uniref:Squalene synthase n=1 Tax=Dipteronia dyeriana TaxID=168575 RepID=A0AAE0CVZ5_9ROSI|nr:hypothetical protein Ddye_003998 [Dipteronia dyeriana]